MAVDPERLFAYWELTDPDLERARAMLPAGSSGRLVLRVYDTTGRIFDGSNAHHSFDVPVERTDRQWFLNLNRPESRAVVEIGVVGAQGSFAPLARSSPVDFPRREPPPLSEPEWRVAEEVAEPGRVPRVRLEVPANIPGSVRSASGAGRVERRAASHPAMSSEERLAAERRSGGGSEERLRDGKKNGSTRDV